MNADQNSTEGTDVNSSAPSSESNAITPSDSFSSKASSTNALKGDTIRYGATVLEWDALMRLVPCKDLLAVVCNPSARISHASSLGKIGKVPSEYNASGLVRGFRDWTGSHETKIADINRYKRRADYGAFVQTRGTVRALDVDIIGKGLAAEVRQFVMDYLKLSELTYRFRASVGKWLLPFRLPADSRGAFRKMAFPIRDDLRTDDLDKVEFLAEGNGFVAVGYHVSDGEPYLWSDNLGLPPTADETPLLTREQFEDLWRQLQLRFGEPNNLRQSKSPSPHNTATAAADPMLQRLEEEGLIRGRRRDGAYNVYCPWMSEHSEDSGPSEATYWPQGLLEHGKAGFKCQHAHCQDRKIGALSKHLGIEFGLAPQTNVPAYTFFTILELLSQPSLKWFIKGVLPQAPLLLVYGESGGGKSFFLLDMMVSLAMGRPWNGIESRPARIAWVAAEGQSGHKSRIQALLNTKCSSKNPVPMLTQDAPLFTLTAAPNLLDDSVVESIITAIQDRGGADVIVLDTQSQVMQGADENSSKDVGRFLAACRRIHDATGATIIPVHHAGKDASKGARGWSGLFAAMDAVIEVKRDIASRVARITKLKDGESGKEFCFKLRPVWFGWDDADSSSAVVEYVDPPHKLQEARTKKNGPLQDAIYKALDALAASNPTIQRFGHAQIVQKAKLAIPMKGKRDRREDTLNRAMRGMINCGLLTSDGEVVTWPRNRSAIIPV